MSEQPPSRRDGRSVFAVSSWSLRRKVALALAIPLVLAVTLGGLRVAGDLNAAANSSASARQVTVLRPAFDYLTAASRAMVAAQSDTWASESEINAAVADMNAAADDLERTRTSADLTVEQSRQIDVVLALSRVLREESRSLSRGTWVAQLRQLQSGVTRLIATIANAQIEPQPRLQMLTEALTGRFSLAMQQALAATSRAGDDASLDLFAELGTESAAIDRLAGDLGETEAAVTDLLTDNARRTRTVRTGGTDLGGARAYAGYDGLVDTLLQGVDAELAASAAAARTRALLNGGLTAGALLAAILLALMVSRLLLTPIRTVREGALAVAHDQLPDAVARIRAGGEPAPITPIDVHHDGGSRPARTSRRRPAPPSRRPGGRRGRATCSGQRDVRDPVAAQHLAGQPAARAHRRAGEGRGGPFPAREPVPAGPPRLPDAAYGGQPPGPRRRRRAAHRPAGVDGRRGDASRHRGRAGLPARPPRREHPSTRIADEAASDVVHLLTELVDNALAYSSPSTSVAIGSVHTADGVVLDIVDAGLGIPDDTRGELNDGPAPAVRSRLTPPGGWDCSSSAGSRSATASRCS